MSGAALFLCNHSVIIQVHMKRKENEARCQTNKNVQTKQSFYCTECRQEIHKTKPNGRANMYYRKNGMKSKGERTHQENGTCSCARAPPNSSTTTTTTTTTKKRFVDSQQRPNPPIPSTITFAAATHNESKESTANGQVPSMQALLQRLHDTKKRCQQAHKHGPLIDDTIKNRDCSKLQTQQQEPNNSVGHFFDENPVVNKILSELYHDFLTEATANGDLNALSNDDKLLLEVAFAKINRKSLVARSSRVKKQYRGGEIINRTGSKPVYDCSTTR